MVCGHCGKEFNQKNIHQKWCSPYCRGLIWHKNNYIAKKSEIKKCDFCRKEFETTNSKRKYCSKECNWKNHARQRSYWRPKGFLIKCAWCGVEFTQIFRRYPTLKRLKKYCSRKCAVKGTSKYKKGGIKCKICGSLFCNLLYGKGGTFKKTCSLKCSKINKMKDAIDLSNKIIKEIADQYIINLIKNRRDINKNDIPQSFIDCYREYIKIKRLMGGSKNDEHQRPA